MRFLRLAPVLLLAACMGAEAPAPAPATISEPEAEAPAAAPIETAPVVLETPALPMPEPMRLPGLNPKEVQALMGEPSFVRRDANVQIMLFETHACVFEIIFYEPNPDAHFHADHLNARSPGGADIDLQTCLIEVLPNGQWLDMLADNR